MLKAPTHTDPTLTAEPDFDTFLANKRNIEDELDWRENQGRPTGFTFPWQLGSLIAAATAITAAIIHYI